MNLNAESAEVGYFIDADFHRQGYAQGALLGVIEQLERLKRVRRIAARARPENLASKELLTKHGFLYEGTSRSAFRNGLGIWSDVDNYALRINRQ